MQDLIRVVLEEKKPLGRNSNVGEASGPKVTSDTSGLFPQEGVISIVFMIFILC